MIKIVIKVSHLLHGQGVGIHFFRDFFTVLLNILGTIAYTLILQSTNL